jgi:L-histidine N-alpha-methyltransferase
MSSIDRRIDVDVHFDPDASLATMRAEVRAGLTGRPKTLPSKYFYDERGSLLFERITELDEYYPTRAEREVLETHSGAIARAARPREVVELGSGSAKKTRLLLDAALEEGELRRYVPFDVSREIAESSARELVREFPDLSVHAVVGDFDEHLGEIPDGDHRLIALLGGTIGNFERDDAVALLAEVRSHMGPHDHFLLGTDLVKDVTVLESAYDDSAGVTAEFNKNILAVVNDRLDADFDPDDFDHVAFYDADRRRIEMHLRARRDLVAHVHALDLTVTFAAGETVRTEVSCKYTRESVAGMLEDAGLGMRAWFTDAGNRFAMSLSAREEATARP